MMVLPWRWTTSAKATKGRKEIKEKARRMVSQKAQTKARREEITEENGEAIGKEEKGKENRRGRKARQRAKEKERRRVTKGNRLVTFATSLDILLDCWRKVQQVEDTSATASGSGGPGSTAPTITSQVKRIRLVTPPDLTTTELYDLTLNDEEETEAIDIQYLRVISLEEKEEDEEFKECLEIEVWVPEGTPVVAMDWQDSDEEEAVDEERGEDEELHVRMVQMKDYEEEEAVQITLDSGADVSVLPRSYGNVGSWRQGGREIRMVDAQGREIKHEGITRAKLRIKEEYGKEVDLVEDFMLGNVKHPILCPGKMLRLGWSITPGP